MADAVTQFSAPGREPRARPPAAVPPVDDVQREALKGVRSAFGRTRLRTLISLRWMAIVGQAGALMFVHFGLGFELPMAACLAAVGASAWLNVALMAVFPSQHLSSPQETAAQLGFDTVQLAVLIGLTGGLQNPFLLMILAPVTVGASRLLPAYSAMLAALALACCAAMAMWGLRLPWVPGEELRLPMVFQYGQFAAVAVGLAFFTISSWRTGRDEARLVSALDAVQAVLSREQKLSALGALAAATAHELGTPLATMHIAAKELARSIKKDNPAREDVDLIIEQSERCRAILKQLAKRPDPSDPAHARTPLNALIEEACEAHMGMGRHIRCASSPLSTAGEGQDQAPTIIRKPEIIHALGAFIENAASFATSEVTVNARWSAEEVRVYVTDDGPGFAQSVLAKLGEPYFSERKIEQRGGGLGLGFFIACTLLERTGARVTPYNRQPPAKGAVVRIIWPRAAIEAPPGWNET